MQGTVWINLIKKLDANLHFWSGKTIDYLYSYKECGTTTKKLLISYVCGDDKTSEEWAENAGNRGHTICNTQQCSYRNVTQDEILNYMYKK